MVVHRGAGRLHDEHVRSPDVLPDVDVDLPVAEPLHHRGPHGDGEICADLPGEIDIRVARKQLEPGHTTPLLGKPSFDKEKVIIPIGRPLASGKRKWLGGKGSNLH